LRYTGVRSASASALANSGLRIADCGAGTYPPLVDYPRQSPPGPAFLIFERRIAPLLLVIAIVFGVSLLPIGFLYWAGMESETAEPAATSRSIGRWQPPPTPPARATIFRNVNVLPMDTDRVLGDQDVLVAGGRIVAVRPGSDLGPSADALVVEGSGRFLLPGLADMHVHMPYAETDQMAALELFALNGVTTVLNLHGNAAHLRLRQRIRDGELFAPAFYTSGPYIANAPFYSPDAPEAAAAVRAHKAAGYDIIKIHGDFSRAAYRSVIETAHREGLKVIGHAPRNIGMDPIFEERQDALAHVEEFIYAYYRYGQRSAGVPANVDELTRSIAARTRRARVQVVANLTAYHGIWKQAADVRPLLARPEMAYVPPRIREDWEPERNTYVRRFGGEPRPFEEWYGVLERLVRALDDEGVPLMAGSDAPIPCVIPGFSLHDELRDLVAAGLTPYRALRAATVNASAFLDTPQEFGAVTVGASADLILLDRNPLQDIGALARPAGVMLRGRWLDRAAIEARLEALAAYATPAPHTR
jgi:imidazolonepropionase-like amidohydrolase